MNNPVQTLIRPLSYQSRLDKRDADVLDLVVIHCTELPDLATAREYGERIRYETSGTGNSGHFYIDRDGRIECWVEPLRVAHHVRHYNRRSIGIELVNRGRWPDWYAAADQQMTEPYTAEQTDALRGLLAGLTDQFPGLQWIAGHEDLDRGSVPASDVAAEQVRRKCDPGPLFPWGEILEGTALRRLKPEQ
ncbi:MAG: N-acetylmuramoyl-L-alanine amidase [Xanthomonadales bacterium]|nr:N-acetylmuramoyl-L-alanine amidase [Gammaproteobacteria bacterium]NNE04912.1 N-acetylmuramoyl-L-alanine amidase [Xanthomonadales bacterium]NNL94262.1 N-acetylmuramoyl-L-alanine amidase [Xanthomonadales bacterium]